MDKYNVITPTGNLDDLNIDMANWSNLPFELRMRSNDECIRMYGCTVIDLYNKIKQSILRGIDSRNVDDNNIMIESSLYKEYEDYEEILKASKELQQSPYIVILDPDINSIEELEKKYESFALLNEKNKRLSNDFSWQLWGYNVPNMYDKLSKDLDPIGKDNSNLKFLESSNIYKMESVMLPLKDLYNHSILSGDIITSKKIENNINESGTVPKMISNIKNILESDDFDYTILPAASPWFTPNEYNDYTENLNLDTYNKDVTRVYCEFNYNKSEDSESKLLSLGWNPSVEPTLYNFRFARKRQAKYLREFANIIDVSKLCIEEVQSSSNNEFKVKPLYFILGYDDKFGHFTNISKYNKAGISFDLSLSKIYTFNGLESTFTGFITNTLDDYKYIDIVAIFVDSEAYNKIYKSVNENNNFEYSKINFTSAFSILTKTYNPSSPDNLKIIYSQYINLLFKIANIDEDSHSIVYKDFELNKSTNIFKLYSGLSSEYNEDTIDRIYDILKMLQDNSNKENYIKESSDILSLLEIKSAICLKEE